MKTTAVRPNEKYTLQTPVETIFLGGKKQTIVHTTVRIAPPHSVFGKCYQRYGFRFFKFFTVRNKIQGWVADSLLPSSLLEQPRHHAD